MPENIHIVQLLCPQRHCIIAAVYDPADQTREEIIKGLQGVRTSLKLNPHCGLCHSTELFYEDARTKFKTLEEAMPEFRKEELKNMAAGIALGGKVPGRPAAGNN